MLGDGGTHTANDFNFHSTFSIRHSRFNNLDSPKTGQLKCHSPAHNVLPSHIGRPFATRRDMARSHTLAESKPSLHAANLVLRVLRHSLLKLLNFEKPPLLLTESHFQGSPATGNEITATANANVFKLSMLVRAARAPILAHDWFDLTVRTRSFVRTRLDRSRRAAKKLELC